MYIYTCVYVSVCMRAHICVYLYVCICVYEYARVYEYACVYKCVFIYVCTYNIVLFSTYRKCSLFIWCTNISYYCVRGLQVLLRTNKLYPYSALQLSPPMILWLLPWDPRINKSWKIYSSYPQDHYSHLKFFKNRFTLQLVMNYII